MRLHVTLLVLALCAVPAIAAGATSPADSARARAVRDGWPDTPAGVMAGGWVRAFDGGEKAMRAFLEAHVPDSLMTARPLGERLASYRALRERYGDLMLESVVESKPHQLTAMLIADDARTHRFTFDVEARPPHGLVKVAILQHDRQGHGHGHGSHGR